MQTCSQRSSPTNQHPASYRPDVLPVDKSTVSEHSRKISIVYLLSVFYFHCICVLDFSSSVAAGHLLYGICCRMMMIDSDSEMRTYSVEQLEYSVQYLELLEYSTWSS